MRLRSAFSVLALIAAAGCALADSTQPSIPSQETFAPSLDIDLSTYTQVIPDLYYKDIVVGTGPVVARNKIITGYYTGWLKDGTQFGTNVGGDSLRAPLNDSNFIPGWVEGLPGMKVGGTRRLVIASRYGYGAAGSGPIPAHATLIFEIQIKRVE
jgi:FKBP-type peptidyl-prolyl cis-trans isomerase